jgi:hypothetical protein
MTSTRRFFGALALVLLTLSLVGCTTKDQHPEETMEAWRVDEKKHTAELTAKWKDVGRVVGTTTYTVREPIPLSDPYVPWLYPIDPEKASDGGYYLGVGGGSFEEPKGSGNYYLLLPMRATFPRSVSTDATECHGAAFPGQVAECGGWVIRVLDVNQNGGGSFELLAYPDVPGYRLMQGENDPVPGH